MTPLWKWGMAGQTPCLVRPRPTTKLLLVGLGGPLEQGGSTGLREGLPTLLFRQRGGYSCDQGDPGSAVDTGGVPGRRAGTRGLPGGPSTSDGGPGQPDSGPGIERTHRSPGGVAQAAGSRFGRISTLVSARPGLRSRLGLERPASPPRNGQTSRPLGAPSVRTVSASAAKQSKSR